MRLSFLSILLALISTTLSCPNKDTYCGSCNGNSCVYCYTSYVSAAGVCEDPTTEVKNCLTYETNEKCRECIFGFYLNNNVCTKIDIKNCVRTAPGAPNKCLVCDKGILAVNGVCDKNNKCSIDDCKYCVKEEDVEFCAICKKGYASHVLDDKPVCKKDSGIVKNCLTLDLYDPSYCLLCKAGYYMNSGTCHKSDDYKVNQESARVLDILLMLFVGLLLIK